MCVCICVNVCVCVYIYVYICVCVYICICVCVCVCVCMCVCECVCVDNQYHFMRSWYSADAGSNPQLPDCEANTLTSGQPQWFYLLVYYIVSSTNNLIFCYNRQT